MKWKRRIVYSVLLSVSLLVVCSCVSKKDYLLKVDESKRLSMELEELQSDHTMLAEQKEACDKHVIALQGEKSDLEKENARLKEDNLELEKILQAKSDTLSKNIVDLRDNITHLEKKNSLLQEENKDLRQNLKTLQIDLNNFRNQTMVLQ